MAGIDEQLRMREMAIAGNPQAAQQKYAQSKDLMDLLVAQKVSNDYTSARNAMQAATQTSANPIIDQLDMSNAQVTKNDMMRSLMPGVAIKAGRDQQAMQRQAMGIPSQPAPNIRMADGGIVGYQQGGGVKRFQEGLAVIGDDESRFDVTDNELSPEEAIATDMQRQENMTVDQWMESIGKGAPTAEERARFEGTGMNPYAFRDMGAGILNKLSSAGEVLARQFGSVGRRRAQQETRRAELATEYPDLNKSQINYLLQGEIGKGQINPEAQAQAQTSGTPLGNRVPSKDARREQVADPFDVKGMVDRLVEPEFRMQGVLDAPQIKGPDKKKGMFDNVDIGRLQAFLAGGGGQTNTASALSEGLKGLMGEDQRRETLASKEAIEAAKINSQRYGIEQDFDAAIAKIGAENRRAVFKAQRDALEAYEGDKRELAADALFDITNGKDEQFNQNSMRLQETYGSDPEGLTRELIALTNKTLDNRMRSVEGATGGSNSGVFEVELPSGD